MLQLFVSIQRMHIRLGLSTGDKAAVSQDGNTVELDAIVTAAISPGAALLSMSIEETLDLGNANGSLQIKKA